MNIQEIAKRHLDAKHAVAIAAVESKVKMLVDSILADEKNIIIYQKRIADSKNQLKELTLPEPEKLEL